MRAGPHVHWRRTWLFCCVIACAPRAGSPAAIEAAPSPAAPVHSRVGRGGSGGARLDETPAPASEPRGGALSEALGGASTVSGEGVHSDESSLEVARLEACQSATLPDCHAPASVACPRRFKEVAIGELCGIEGRTRAPSACTYPEGVCACRTVPYCGGAAPTYLQQVGMRWSCAAPRKPGDCPAIVTNGARCGRDGQRCSSGSCGSATECVCESQRLRCITRIVPTPPGAHRAIQPRTH